MSIKHLFKAEAMPGWAVVGIFLILAFSAIAAARDFLMPFTLSVLLFFVFAPFRRFLYRRGVPQWVSALIVLVGLIALIVGLFLTVMGPASELINSAPTFAYRIQTKLGDVAGPLQHLQDVIARIDRLTGVGPAAAPAADATPAPSKVLMGLVAGMPHILAQLLFILLLLFFMMSAGDLLYLKIVQSFPTMNSKRKAYAALRELEGSLGSYLSTITLINAGLGIAIGLAMWAWGMPAAAFLGLIAFMLNYIPYIGPTAGVLLSFVIALVSLDGFFLPVLVAVTWLGCCTVEGNFVTPMLVSRRLEMNTVVVFLAVALWAWLWSIVGMVVAVPILVVARVLCDTIPGLERLGNFIGGEDPAPLGPEAAEQDAAESAARVEAHEAAERTEASEDLQSAMQPGTVPAV